MNLSGKPDAGNLLVRFDEGDHGSPWSLLYRETEGCQLIIVIGHYEKAPCLRSRSQPALRLSSARRASASMGRLNK
jgi:hypothetical protein